MGEIKSYVKASISYKLAAFNWFDLGRCLNAGEGVAIYFQILFPTLCCFPVQLARFSIQNKQGFTMDDGARNWMYKQVHKQFWRVCSWYELEDLVQDGHLCYWLVRDKYPQAQTPEHIMRLFQVTFVNHIHDLAMKKTKQIGELLLTDLLVGSETSEDQFLDFVTPVQQEESTFETYLSKAPAPVKAILKLMASDEGARRLRIPMRIKKTGRELTNDRWCKLIGVDPETIDLPKMLFNYLNAA